MELKIIKPTFKYFKFLIVVIYFFRTASYSHTPHQFGLGAGSAGPAQQALFPQWSNCQAAEPQRSV